MREPVPVCLNLLDEHTVWMLFISEEEVDVLRSCTILNLVVSPFFTVEKWMVVLGHPPCPCWVKMKGVPSPSHLEGIRLQEAGRLLDKNNKVDQATVSQENLRFRRVKNLL